MQTTIFRQDSKSPSFQRDLYRRHYRRIYNTCLRIIGNQMDAEETMHDVFLKLFESIDNLHDEKSFLSWSHKIAIRTAIDRVRRKSVIFEQIDNMSIADDEPDGEPQLSIDIIKQELNKLPNGYRIILTMRLFEECEFEEIAKELQIKESTVRSQYVRGRDNLAKILKTKYYNHE